MYILFSSNSLVLRISVEKFQKQVLRFWCCTQLSNKAVTAVIFVVRKYLINDIIDWFGKDIEFSDETEYDVTVRVNVNLEAMRRWSMQYALHIKVLEPVELVDKVKEDLTVAAKSYCLF